MRSHLDLESNNHQQLCNNKLLINRMLHLLKLGINNNQVKVIQMTQVVMKRMGMRMMTRKNSLYFTRRTRFSQPGLSSKQMHSRISGIARRK